MDTLKYSVLIVTLIALVYVQHSQVAAAGEDCDPTLSQPGNCSDTGEDCTGTAADGTCTCKSGYYQDGTVCKPKIDYGQACTIPDSCSDADTNCYGGSCRCNANLYRNSSCKSIDELKPNTVTITTVGTTTLSVNWQSPVSTLITGYELTTDPSEANQPLVVADKAAIVSGLTAATVYSVHVKSTISYIPGRNEVTGAEVYGPQKTKQVYGGVCDDSTPCSDEGNTIVCIDTTSPNPKRCLCKDDMYRSGSQCQSASTITPNLTASTIGRESITVNWESAAAVGYDASYQVTWGGEQATVPESQKSYTIQPLLPGTTYTVTVVHIITRHERTQKFSSAPQPYTTLSQVYGSDCNTTVPCNNDGGTIECILSVGKCLCTGQLYWNGAKCDASTASNLRPGLPISPPIGTNFINVTWQATDTNYYQSSYSITWEPNGGNGNFTTTGKTYKIENLNEGTKYTVSLTRILVDFGRSRILTGEPRQYDTKISYDQPCTTNDTCIDVQADCYSGACRCNPMFYRTSSNQCSNINDLKPTSVTVTVTGTTTLYVNWTSPDSSIRTGYDVKVLPNEGVVVDPGNSKTTTISGLTPGKQYWVNVSAKISYLSGRDEMTGHLTSSPVRTKPERVTGLDYSQTILISPVITIVFPNPNGEISSYSVNLKGIKGDLNYDETNNVSPAQQNTVTSTTFSDVNASFQYQLTITTLSDTARSDDFITNITIKNKPAGEVSNTGRTVPTSRMVNVWWQQPETPNGALYQYTLTVWEDSSCIRLIIFNCTSCLTNRSSESEDSCTDTKVETIGASDIADPTHIVNYTVTLQPDTSYNLKVAAYNSEGRGMDTSLILRTEIEAPGEPTNFTSIGQTSSTITLSWKPPIPRPGPTLYNVTVHEQNEIDAGIFDFYNLTQLSDYETKEFTFEGLSPYWEYRFTIQAKNNAGESNVVRRNNIRTKESAPTKVKYITVDTIDGVYNKVVVKWECPKQKDGRNGEIMNSNLSYSPLGQTTLHRESGSDPYPNDNDCLWETNVIVTPEYNYTFTVFLNNKGFAGASESFLKYIPPGPPNSDKTTVTVVDGTGGKSQSQTSADIVIYPKDLHNGTNGQVILTGVIACPTGKCPKRKRRQVTTQDYYKGVSTWKQSKASNFAKPYRATQDNWIDDKKDVASFTFTLGQDITCGTASDTVFCNGQLPVGSSFDVYVFACTQGGCSESITITVVTKGLDENLIPIIVGVAVPVVLVIIIVIAVILFLRSRRLKSMKKPGYTPADDLPVEDLIQKKRPIKINEFQQKVEAMHKDSNLLFSEEFEDITSLSPKLNCTSSENGGNKLKNRYVNILPFDHSRVKLLPTEDDDDEETDYINANYIPGYRSLREYIATQGPMTGTVNDFWRLIWEQNVPIIVMLSDLMEKGKPKVDRYYPENMEPVQYGDIIVEMTNFSPLSKYVIRIFKLQMGDEIRMVRHYFLPGWQDFGANLTSDDVINFVKSVRMEIKPNTQGPMCIHCSAGVGRTGTYISLDVFQQHIDEEDMKKELDIFDFVMRMRQNRSYMVQTEKQYIFIHDTIKEMIIRKKKEMSERDHIYQNHDADENVYQNQAFETDPGDIYMNVDSSGKPTTVL